MARKLNVQRVTRVTKSAYKAQPVKAHENTYPKTLIALACGAILVAAVPTFATTADTGATTSTSMFTDGSSTTASTGGNTPLSSSTSSTDTSGAVTASSADPTNAAALATNATTDGQTVASIALNECAPQMAAQNNSVIQGQVALFSKPINMDDLFNVAKSGGCFNALQNLPDLSVAIPSFTGIINSVEQTMLKYATQKVCNVVNDATKSMLDPINSAMTDLNKYTAYASTSSIDKAMAGTLLQFDPSAMGSFVPVSGSQTYTLSGAVDQAASTINSSTSTDPSGTTSTAGTATDTATTSTTAISGAANTLSSMVDSAANTLSTQTANNVNQYFKGSSGTSSTSSSTGAISSMFGGTTTSSGTGAIPNGAPVTNGNGSSTNGHANNTSGSGSVLSSIFHLGSAAIGSL